MLVRLMAADQVVLLVNSSGLYLFYHGKVHFRKDRHFQGIPKCRTTYHVWTLVDADNLTEGPSFDFDSIIWPIQASSPNPDRFVGWVKQYEAPTLGMPLWSMEELIKG